MPLSQFVEFILFFSNKGNIAAYGKGQHVFITAFHVTRNTIPRSCFQAKKTAIGYHGKLTLSLESGVTQFVSVSSCTALKK
ncbi:hypothetical protein NQ317_007021 [Molorchus minor]|uniref:Uncharacterized protein n=1 Tax=Molorchus minor TaxID=1323400 RepID=A0ABQ9JTQ9_9CUCU|nr:hypothetical protein NQ317_007021 [Molorchus minor]